MRKTLVSILAVATVLSLAVAPASANSRHGFGLAALAIGVVGAVVGAEIAVHSEHAYQESECFTRSQALYDRYGNYVGRRSMKDCD